MSAFARLFQGFEGSEEMANLCFLCGFIAFA